MLPVCAVVLSGCLATGCGSSDKSDDTPSPSTAPQTTSASPGPDRTAEAKTQAVAAYEDMWRTAVQVYTSGSLTNPDLAKYATDKALSNIKVTGAYYQDHGMTVQGEPSLAPRATSVSFAKKPYAVNITDCVDSTHYLEVYRATGKAVHSPAGSRRHVVTAVVGFNGTSWIVSDFTIERDRTC